MQHEFDRCYGTAVVWRQQYHMAILNVECCWINIIFTSFVHLQIINKLNCDGLMQWHAIKSNYKKPAAKKF